jgi:hypothetical protein
MSDIHVQESCTTVLPRIKPSPKSSKLSPGQFFYAPSDDGTDENLLILLHGLGLYHYYSLGRDLKVSSSQATLTSHFQSSVNPWNSRKQLSLLSVHQNSEKIEKLKKFLNHHFWRVGFPKNSRVPFLYEESYQWFSSFNDLGEIIERPNPTPALQYLSKIIDHLINGCAWPMNRIHLFGFAQGGSVAAEFVIDLWKQQQLRIKKPTIIDSNSNNQSLEQESVPLGSIVTVSGPLLSYPTISTLCPTPILIAHRPPPSDMALPPGAFTAFKKAFGPVTESQMETNGTGMPASKQEWDPIMRFWSHHLVRRQVEGLYEVMSGSGN